MSFASRIRRWHTADPYPESDLNLKTQTASNVPSTNYDQLASLITPRGSQATSLGGRLFVCPSIEAWPRAKPHYALRRDPMYAEIHEGPKVLREAVASRVSSSRYILVLPSCRKPKLSLC